jgi:hypothetical protein
MSAEFFKTVCKQTIRGKRPDSNKCFTEQRHTDRIHPITYCSTSDRKTTRAGRSVRPPNRLQLNNLTVDVFTILIAGKVRNQLRQKRDKSKSRNNSKNRVQDRESRKDQCCQGAGISAATLKRGPTKMCAAEKIRGRIFFKYAKKGQKRGRTFLKMIIHIKNLKYLQKSTLRLLISLIFRPLYREK